MTASVSASVSGSSFSIRVPGRAQDGEGLVLGLAVRRGDDGGDDAHARRQFARQPVQPVRAVGGVELVERVEDEDDAPSARGFGEEFLEMGDEVLDVERQGLGVAGGEGDVVAEAAECAAEVGGAGAGADEVGGGGELSVEG